MKFSRLLFLRQYLRHPTSSSRQDYPKRETGVLSFQDRIRITQPFTKLGYFSPSSDIIKNWLAIFNNQNSNLLFWLFDRFYYSARSFCPRVPSVPYSRILLIPIVVARKVQAVKYFFVTEKYFGNGINKKTFPERHGWEKNKSPHKAPGKSEAFYPHSNKSRS